MYKRQNQHWASTVDLEPTHNYVQKLPAAIDAPMVANNVYEFVDAPSTSTQLSSSIENQNSAMESAGFSDFSKSEVYAAPSGPVFYCAYADGFWSDARDMCMAVFNENPENGEPTVILEGPGTVAIGLAGDELQGEELSPEEVENILVPLRPINQG